jgi:hypothetical protein
MGNKDAEGKAANETELVRKATTKTAKSAVKKI